MLRRTPLLALALSVAISCAQEGDDSRTPAETGSAKAAAPAEAEPASAKPKRRERPLPAFSGWTLDHERLDISSLIGKRLLLVFFNPEIDESVPVIQAVAGVSGLRGKYNFDIVGVATGSEPKRVGEFAARHKLDYQVFDDSSAAIARKLGMRQPLAMLGVDAQGFVAFGLGQFSDDAVAIEGQLRDSLRLPPLASDSDPALGNRPLAPDFTTAIMDGGEFTLSKQRGKPAVLIFFLHTCPHCHETLEFMKEALAEIPEDKRPKLVGLEVSGRTSGTRQTLGDMGLDFFPVVFDSDGDIRDAYGVLAGVPDTFLIDAEGHIAHRIRGWRAEHDAPLARMRLAKLSGSRVPMLLSKNGFTGSEACGVCHESEHETWLFTRHATAFDTLVKHGDNSDAECIGCHVVGFQKPGGFESAAATPALENVGCESCHGRGGPHLSPGFTQAGNYSTACATCHDAKHSLGFEYGSFLPRISHAANAHVLSLSLAEKQELLGKRGVRVALLPTNADYVGSDACRACHESEHATWAAGPHARAAGTLANAGEAGNATCLKCHTTAFGRPGGFPEDGAVDSHADLARVGCESCHGPGGDHIIEDAVKVGNIVSLTDKCDSCVILQICGSCHDEANDPGFEFEVDTKIEAQRHGTIEPSNLRSTAIPGTPVGDWSGADVSRAVGAAFAAAESGS